MTMHSFVLMVLAFYMGGAVHATMVNWVVHGTLSFWYGIGWPLSGVATVAVGREAVLEATGLKEWYEVVELERKQYKLASEQFALTKEQWETIRAQMLKEGELQLEEHAGRQKVLYEMFEGVQSMMMSMSRGADQANDTARTIMEIYTNWIDDAGGNVLPQCQEIFLMKGGTKEEWEERVLPVIQHALTARANEVSEPIVMAAAGLLASGVERDEVIENTAVAIREGIDGVMKRLGVEVWDRASGESGEALDKDSEGDSLEKGGKG